jgi:Flp pilus assembly protein TadG
VYSRPRIQHGSIMGMRHARRLAGHGLAEFAVVVPVLMGVVFTIMGIGFWLYAQLVVAGAAQEGARVAAREGATLAEGQRAAEQFLVSGLGPRATSVAVRVAEDPDLVVVEVAGQFPVSVMLGQPVGMPLHASAQLARERFRPGGT